MAVHERKKCVLWAVPMKCVIYVAPKCSLCVLAPGDEVQEDDIIAQIETDKVTIDVKYQQPGSGVVKELLIKVMPVTLHPPRAGLWDSDSCRLQ